jgi:hypothetical protein
MTESVYRRLYNEAAAAGFKGITLYITEREAKFLAREIVDNLSEIGVRASAVGAVERVLVSNTASMFNQPLRLKPEERS